MDQPTDRLCEHLELLRDELGAVLEHPEWWSKAQLIRKLGELKRLAEGGLSEACDLALLAEGGAGDPGEGVRG